MPVAGAGRADAHPAPFSHLDVRLDDGGITGTLVLHVVDVAHELELTGAGAAARRAGGGGGIPWNRGVTLRDRLAFAADGRALTVGVGRVETGARAVMPCCCGFT